MSTEGTILLTLFNFNILHHGQQQLIMELAMEEYETTLTFFSAKLYSYI